MSAANYSRATKKNDKDGVVRHGKLLCLPPANAEGCGWWSQELSRLPQIADKGRILPKHYTSRYDG